MCNNHRARRSRPPAPPRCPGAAPFAGPGLQPSVVRCAGLYRGERALTDDHSNNNRINKRSAS